MITIQQIDLQHPLFEGVFDLREQVLRQPLGLSLHNEDLSEEADDTIFAAVDNQKVIGCVMGRAIGADKLKLRQMAGTPPCRQKESAGCWLQPWKTLRASITLKR